MDVIVHAEQCDDVVCQRPGFAPLPAADRVRERCEWLAIHGDLLSGDVGAEEGRRGEHDDDENGTGDHASSSSAACGVRRRKRPSRCCTSSSAANATMNRSQPEKVWKKP